MGDASDVGFGEGGMGEWMCIGGLFAGMVVCVFAVAVTSKGGEGWVGEIGE